MTVQRLLRRPEVEKLTGKTRAGIYEDMAAGRFPKPVRMGPRAVAWLESEIGEWLESRVAERDTQTQT